MKFDLVLDGKSCGSLSRLASYMRSIQMVPDRCLILRKIRNISALVLIAGGIFDINGS